MAQRPFYSPNVGVHCSDGECAAVSWGTHAHVPTNFTSRTLYITRFRDCGDGVVEAVWQSHNFGVPGVHDTHW